MNRSSIVILGVAATLGSTALWHGPLGAGERLAARAETTARRTLDYYDMPMIQARMERGPLSRRLILSGPADDFQRSELVRILDDVPGVLDVRWDPASLPQEYRTAK
ncbi:hypothetical protein [Sphingomonas edaphi]|uniref:BON domain-containing protein n=1 Tax=Sphingomonas edaphi TaxID=2315689 RepID=A0A418Q368_9SPHN|nr:hypothetical protein [Sphingomonas edaphi]RIX32334.1 hypothetical protein D3M59_05125 [Sphingomonas edaphi]